MFDGSIIPQCPTLMPNDLEFSDPIAYLSRPDIKQLGYEFGIVKIVPPYGWHPQFLLAKDFDFHTRLQKLGDLGITTRSRRFFTENLNRFLKMRRKKPVQVYFTVGGKAIYYYDLYTQVDKSSLKGYLEWSDWQLINHHFKISLESRALQDEYLNTIQAYADFLNDHKTDQLPDSDSDDDNESCLICGDYDLPGQTLLCDNCDNPYHARCVGLDSIPDGNWYCNKCLIGTGEYGFEEEVDRMFSLEEFYGHCMEFQKEFFEKYGPLNLDQIEQKFWDFVDEQNNDIEVRYGADIHKSIPGQISGFPMHNTPQEIKNSTLDFEKYSNHPFNLTNLPYSKGSLLNYINHSISGMTVPWIYVGSLLSTFCWHTEDHYTLSANYCHFGSTKKWYGIPAADAEKFEALMRSKAPDLFKKQPDLLHQLVTLISPSDLIKNGIRCFYANQNPNEFIVTYPRVYHAGFNSGFNFNEAVNFTMDLWLEYGEDAIENYKLIKKENVFNQFKLIENVLINFSVDKETNIDLVQRCLASYKRFVSRTKNLLGKLSGDFDTMEVSQKINYESYLSDNNRDEEDDEELCDICKTHISHVFCIVNNEDRDFSLPIVNQEAVVPRSKMSINQLLTPEASPHEEPINRFKIEDDQEKKTLKASALLNQIVNDKETLQQVKDGMSGRKLRKSNRIEKLRKETPMKSKMSMITTISDLNDKDEIKLCLQCGCKLTNVPENSITMVNVSTQEMERFITTIEGKLRTTK